MIRARTLLASIAFALIVAGGAHVTYSSFTATPLAVGGSSFVAATLDSFTDVDPGTDTQPGTQTLVAAGNANALSIDLGAVPSPRTFSSVFTVLNTTAQPLALTLSPTVPGEVASVKFASSGTTTVTLAANASSAVQIQTSALNAGVGSGTIRLGLTNVAALYRDYPLSLVEAPAAPASLTATPQPAGAISLSWAASTTTGDLGGYNVFRSIGTGQPVQLNGNMVTGTSFVDTQTATGTAYTYTVQAAATTPSGLSSLSSPSATATADAVPPTVTLATVNGAAASFPLATNATVTTVGGACESAAGDAPVSWSVSGDATESGTAACSSGAWAQTLTTALPAEGHYTLSATQADAAGNVGASGGKAITIDKTKPVITATALAGGAAYAAGTWTNQSVTVSFTCADTGSIQSGLVTNTVGGGGTQSVETSNGSYTNTGTCTDAAGNTAVALTFSPIKIDKTSPVVTAAAKNADLTAYTAGTWTRQAVTVSFTCADTGAYQSGLATDTIGGGGTQNTDTANGGYTSTGTCTDAAGNSASPVTFGPIKVDQTPPSGGSVDGTGLVGTDSRYALSTTLSIAFTKGTDATSGLAPTGATLWGAQGTLSSAGGTADGTCSNYGAYAQAAADPTSPFASAVPTDDACYKAQYRVPDVAGNVATYTSGDIKVETTAPGSLTPTFAYSNVVGSVYPTGSTVYFKDATTGFGSVTLTANATDAYSGISGYSFPAPPTGWTVTGSGAARTYSYSGTSVTGGSLAVSATNNASKSVSTTLTFTADNNIPVVVLTAPANGSATNVNKPTFGGTCDSSGGAVTVTVSQGGSTVQTDVDNTCTASAFSVAASATLPDGTYIAQATQARGGHTGTSDPVSFTVDTVKPSVTINQAAGQSDPTNASPIDFTATFSEPVTGFAATDVTHSSGTVTVSGGPTVYDVQVTGMTNNAALTVSIAAGVASDPAGNQNTASTSTDNSVTYDTTPPAVTLTKLNGNTVTFPLSTTANVTSFAGACGTATRDIATVSWSITGASTQSGSVACTAGAWTVTPTALSAEGVYALTATQQDQATNTGTSGAQSVTIDRTAPTVTLTTPANNGWANSATPTLSGAAGNATGDSTTVTVKIYNGTTTGGTLLQTLTPTRTAATWTTTATTLAQGSYTAQATQTDAANNTGTSTANTFTIDTTAPVVTLTKVNGSTVTFPLNTNTASITTIGGSCGTATGDTTTVNWAVTGGTSQNGTTTCTTGTWTTTLTTALSAESTYSLTATQQDQATNTGTSGAQSVTIDRTAPTVTLTTPANNGWANSATPTLSGAAGNATGDSTTVTVKIYNGTTTGGTLLQTLTPTRTAATWTTTATTLAQGSYTAQATQTDAANNTGTSTANTFTIDTTAPVVTLTKVNGSTVTFPLNTNTASITTIGGSCGTATGDTTTVNWAVTGGTSQNGTTTCTTGTWTTTLTTALSTQATYMLAATQADSAGNTGTTGNESATIDRTAPVPAGIVAANGNGTVGYLGAGNGTPDALTFSYTDTGGVNPASIVAGWDGTGTKSVNVTFTNAATDSIAVPGLGTVTLGTANYLTSTSTQAETLSMTGTNVFVLTITATPTGSNTTTQAAANFTWSTTGGTATDYAGNAAAGSVTTNTQRF